PPVHTGGLLRPQSQPPLGRRHRNTEGAPTNGRDPAYPARFLARRSAIRPRPRGARDRRWARRVVRRRRLYRAAALGLVADGLGSRLIGARRSRVSLRAACQWWHSRLARQAAPQLRALQRARQRRAPPARPADARNRSQQHPRSALGDAPAGDAAITPGG